MNSLNKTAGMLFCLSCFGFLGFYDVQPAAAEETPSELYVRTVPDGAKVFLNGTEVGVTPGLFKVEPGTAKIVVKLEGCVPIEREVEIKASKITRIELSLKSHAKNDKSGTFEEPNADDAPQVIEGVGWGAFKVGATREELVKAVGEPEANPEPNNPWVPWLSRYHVNCLFSEPHGATAIQFNEGFEFSLTSGIKIGSLEKDVIASYGKPELVVPNPLAKQFQYSTRGIFMYIMNGKVSSFMVVKPVKLKAQALNILKNPGAEAGKDTPDNWEQGAALDDVTYSWDNNVAFAGKSSLCIEKTAQTYFPIAQWSQTVERKGIQSTLLVSAQVKAENMTKAILDVVFLDENNNWISHKWVAYIGAKNAADQPANHDWKKYSGKVNIPPKTKKLCIGLQVYGPGKVWFDDIQASYSN